MSINVIPFTIAAGPGYQVNQSIEQLCVTDHRILECLRCWFAAQKTSPQPHRDWRAPLYALGSDGQTCAVCASLLALLQLYANRPLQIHIDLQFPLSRDEALYLQMLWELQQDNSVKAAKLFTEQLHPLVQHMALKSAWDFAHALRQQNARLMQRPQPARVITLKKAGARKIAL